MQRGREWKVDGLKVWVKVCGERTVVIVGGGEGEGPNDAAGGRRRKRRRMDKTHFVNKVKKVNKGSIVEWGGMGVDWKEGERGGKWRKGRKGRKGGSRTWRCFAVCVCVRKCSFERVKSNGGQAL